MTLLVSSASASASAAASAAAAASSHPPPGRYLYTQVRTIPDRYFIIHLYVVGQDDTVLDISITNLFKECKLVTLAPLPTPYTL